MNGSTMRWLHNKQQHKVRKNKRNFAYLNLNYSFPKFYANTNCTILMSTRPSSNFFSMFIDDGACQIKREQRLAYRKVEVLKR